MKKYNPHTQTNCSAQNLIIVSEGVQCVNCLALVIDNRSELKAELLAIGIHDKLEKADYINAN